jgi:hypothetical protein
MVNRARHDKVDLGDQVGSKVYQPSFEPAQEKRLADIIRNPQFHKLAGVAEEYWANNRPVPHTATHFLAPESTMLALEAKEPNKYKSWRDWTGFNPETKSYGHVAFRDTQHAFLNPDAPAATNPQPPGIAQVPRGATPVEYDPFDADTAKLLAQISPHTASASAPTALAPSPQKFDPQGNYQIANDIALPNVKLAAVDHDPWNVLAPVEHNPFETLK